MAECLRVLRPAGALLMSTPEPDHLLPGRDTPINPFHTRELNAAELTELLTAAGVSDRSRCTGVFMATRLAGLDARHGGSIIDAQIARALADAPWPDDLLADVASVTTRRLRPASTHGDRDIDDSLDLVAIAVRP